MSTQAQLTKLPAPAAMLQMIQGFWVSRAICVAAELGIPDLLKDGPKEERRVSASRWSFRRWATDGMGMHGPPGTRLFSQSQRHSLLLRNRALAWPIHRELSSKCDVDNLGGNHYEQDLCTDSRNLAWRMGMA